MSLLFRRQLDVSLEEGGGPTTTIVASFYYPKVDSGYQSFMAEKAQSGVFDWYILRRMNENVAEGVFDRALSLRIILIFVILGKTNTGYPVGVQTIVTSPAKIHTNVELADEELLKTPTSTRLTSYAKGHYLDLYH